MHGIRSTAVFCIGLRKVRLGEAAARRLLTSSTSNPRSPTAMIRLHLVRTCDHDECERLVRNRLPPAFVPSFIVPRLSLPLRAQAPSMKENLSPVPPLRCQPITSGSVVKSTRPSIRAAQLSQAMHTYCDTKRGPLTFVRMPDCSALRHHEGDPAESSAFTHTIIPPGGNRGFGPAAHNRASVPSAHGRRYSRADAR